MSADRSPVRGGPAIRTFLIADVRGYTRFTAEHGDEAATALATTFADLVGDGVEAWGGRLVELRGDEALAVFDSARLALRCAAELQDAFTDETAASPERPLGVGIGLDAGEAVPVGDGFRGAALNLAARLCGIAAAGEVIASEGLVHLAGPIDGLEYSRRSQAELKGIDGPTEVVLVTVQAARAATSDRPSGSPAPSASASAGLPSAGLPSALDPIVPLVGRAADFRWLRWHWRRARHGHGRTVVLSGPPGIGKTRLAAELAVLAAGDSEARIRYLPSGRGLTEDDASPVSPSLVIIDDLDAAPAAALDEAVRLAQRFGSGRGLLLVTHREALAPALVPIIERLAPSERRRELAPLDPEAIRSIAALYAGRAVDDLPLGEIVDESGGVPATVHRIASHRARLAAAGRLGTSAERTAVGRRDLRLAEATLVGDVTDLELVQERHRLYALDRADAGETPRVEVCPYKGLAAFEAADAEYYFGRERLVAELVARFVGAPLLGLIGASGSGKSSALRAGLLPALAGGVLPGSDTWLQVLIRPGEHPLEELGRALRRLRPEADATSTDSHLSLLLAALPAGAQLVVAVDQFEEVFSTTRDEAERGALIELLTSERSGLKVVLTLRADHYGHCARYPALARALAADQVLVGPLSSAEVEAVIEHPARRAGLRTESGLTAALVADAGSEPGVLPLLSTALLELWRAREGGRLTLAAYRQQGGLEGAVARLAEASWAELDPGQQAAARSILLRLAGPGEGEGVVRRRVARMELDAEADPVVARVLDRLTTDRLLTAGDGYVEVAHEALLREWPRYQAWLAEDAAGRALRLHLIGAVRDWEQRGREPGDLYRGARLSAALDWAVEHRDELNSAERGFLDESRSASQREVDRERRTNRRLRALLAGTALLLVIAVGAGAFALVQAGVANDQATLAAQREEVARQAQEAAQVAERFARSRELAASAIGTLTEDPSLSKLLAVAAARGIEPDLEITSALHRVMAADPVVGRYAVPDSQPDEELWADLHPNGDIFVAAIGNRGPHDRIEIVEWATDRVLWSYTPPPGASVGYPFFTPDGTRLVAGVVWDPGPGEEGSPYASGRIGVHIWDARDGDLQEVLKVGRCGAFVEAVAIDSALIQTFPEATDDSPDCFAGDPGEALDLIRFDDGALTRVADRAFFDRRLSADGRYAAFSNLADGFAGTVVDLATGERVLRIDPEEAGVQDRFIRGLSPDGTRLLYGTRPTRVFAVRDGSLVATFGGTGGEGGEATVAPDGRTVYSTARDGTLRGFDVDTGAEVLVLPAAGSGRPSVSTDGIVLVTAPADRTAVVVDSLPRAEAGVVRTCEGFIAAHSLTVHDDTAMFSGFCGVGGAFLTATVVDLADLRPVRTFELHDGQDLVLAPDGHSFLGQEIDEDSVLSPLRIRDVATGASGLEFDGICYWDLDIDRGEEERCRPFPERPFALLNWALEWSPDGSLVAATDDLEGYLAVWDARSGALVHTVQPEPDSGYFDVYFSPDSRELLASRLDGELIAWSTETWRITRQATLDPSIGGRDRVGFAGMAAGGSLLIAVGGYSGFGGGWLYRLDPSTLELVGTTEAHDGSPKSMDVSPDGSKVVTGASDGILRVWEATTGRLLDQVQFDGQVQGVRFLDDQRVLVAPVTGHLFIVAVDPDALVDIVSGSLTRGFTPEECERFNFGNECPTVAELQARG